MFDRQEIERFVDFFKGPEIRDLFLVKKQERNFARKLRSQIIGLADKACDFHRPGKDYLRK